MESTQTTQPPVRTIYLDRTQMQWGAIDLESLIDLDHPARTIWEISGELDLSRFEAHCKAREGEAGRPCWPAQLLVSIWIYSYTLGVASARAIARMMKHEPGLRWLSADQEINAHTLGDFRVGHQAALEEMFAQFLGLLDEAGVVDLRRLLHDGTKVKAVAGRGSYHGLRTLQDRVRQGRKVIRKLDQEAAAQHEGMDGKHEAAKRRAAREALQRAQAALEKLKKLQAEAAPSQQQNVRVSESEPDARRMKQPDGGWALSYNVQVTTEAQSRMIVGIGVTDAGNDTQELMPAVEKAQANTGVAPEQVIADNGYATRANVEQTSERNLELIAPWKTDESREAGACQRNGIAAAFGPSQFRGQRGGQKLQCPAGKKLILIQQITHHGVRNNVFEARPADCNRCRWRKACCGKRGGPRRVERAVESPAMKQYLERMQRPEVKQLYRKRCEIAEFPHLWAKGVKKWRRFSVRGLVKAGIEALWVAMAYNVSQWLRIKSAIPVAA